MGRAVRGGDPRVSDPVSGKVAVTGATGFIGRAIVRRLQQDGRAVVALSSTELDLLRAESGEIERLFAAKGVTACIHAAWYTRHADYLTHAVNRDWVAASLRLADGFAAAGGRRFLSLGSCAEYALGRIDGPCIEDETPIEPATFYGQCKRDLSEALGERDLDLVWPRIFFVYGPGDRRERLVPSLIDGFRREAPQPPRFGGLWRDYIHVDDLADQIVRLLDSDLEGPVNTGTGQAPTLASMYGVIAQQFGVKARDSIEAVGDEPPLILAGLDRLRSAIGDPGCRPLADGLSAMIAAGA